MVNKVSKLAGPTLPSWSHWAAQLCDVLSSNLPIVLEVLTETTRADDSDGLQLRVARLYFVICRRPHSLLAASTILHLSIAMCFSVLTSMLARHSDAVHHLRMGPLAGLTVVNGLHTSITVSVNIFDGEVYFFVTSCTASIITLCWLMREFTALIPGRLFYALFSLLLFMDDGALLVRHVLPVRPDRQLFLAFGLFMPHLLRKALARLLR